MLRKKITGAVIAAVFVAAIAGSIWFVGRNKTTEEEMTEGKTGGPVPVQTVAQTGQDLAGKTNPALPSKEAGREEKPTPMPERDGGKAVLTLTPAGGGGEEEPTQPPEGGNGEAVPILTPEGGGGEGEPTQPPAGDGGGTTPTPLPVLEEPTLLPVPTFAQTPTSIPAPTFAPTPTEVPAPTKLPEPEATKPPVTPTVPKPGVTSTVAPTRKPTEAPAAANTPKPTQIPTAAPVPTGELGKEGMFTYFCTELAKACRISGEDAVFGLRAKGILTFSAEGEGIKRKEAFILLKNAADYLNQEGDGRMQAVVVRFDRLSDVGALNELEKMCAYYVYANGIVEGTSDGDFTRTRRLAPEDGLTAEDARTYIDRLSGKEKRRVLAPDGQLTRTSTRKNMDLYPYILDSIPDSFYTRVFRFMRLTREGKQLYNSGIDDGDGTVWTDGGGNYASPVMVRKMHGIDGTAERYHVFDSVVSEKALEDAVEEYLWKAFNVDYRKTPTDSEWRTYMREMLRGQAMGIDVDKSHDALVENYLRIMKENHTVIECDMVHAEASTVFESIGGTYIRCYVHYRVVSYDSAETVWTSVDNLKGNINPLLFNLATENYPMVELKNLKAGEWRDGYFDIRLGQNAREGIAPMKVCSVEFKDVYNEYSITDY